MAEKKNKKETFEVFPLKKTASVTWLSVAALVLSVAGIILSSIRIYKNGVDSFYDWLKNPFLLLVCVFAIVVVTALLMHSEYRVSEKELISCYGFIKSRLPLSEITSATSDAETNKIFLTLSTAEGQLVIVTAPDKREDLVRAMLKGNPSIDYGFTFRDKPEEEQ